MTASGPGEQVLVNDPFAGGTHLNDITLVAPVLRRAAARRVGGQPGPPRRRRRRGAGFDARPTRPRSTRRGCACRRCASTTTSRAILLANSRTPVERAGDLDAQVGANVVGVAGLAALADAPLARGARLRRAPDAGRARRAARRRAGASTTCSTRSGRVRSAAAHAGGRRPDDRRRARSPSTSPAPTPSAGGNVNAVEAVTVSAVAFRPALGDRSDHPGQRRRAAPGDRGRARRAPSWRPRPAGGGRRRQRRGQPAGGRRLPRRAGPGRARSGRRAPRQGTMNNVLIGGDGGRWPRPVGLLRDRRRRPGRPPRPRRHERRAHRHDQHGQVDYRSAGRVPASREFTPA